MNRPLHDLEVSRLREVYRLVAGRDFEAGERLLAAEGRVAPRPDRFSLQIGPEEHLVIPEGVAVEEQMDRFPWRLLNHSCDPNTLFRGCELFALRPIAAGEELSFDYETTEWELASPFVCACGAVNCRRGPVRGYLHATPERRTLLGETAASHLRLRLDAAAASS